MEIGNTNHDLVTQMEMKAVKIESIREYISTFV